MQNHSANTEITFYAEMKTITTLLGTPLSVNHVKMFKCDCFLFETTSVETCSSSLEEEILYVNEFFLTK